MNPRVQHLSGLVARELAAAAAAEANGEFAAAWVALERAHIAAQPMAAVHTRVHARMIRLAWRQRDLVELLGQIVLISVAGIGSLTGIYPVGGGRFRQSGLDASGIPKDIVAAIPRAASIRKGSQ